MHTVINKATGEVREYTDEEFIVERDRRLHAWEDAKTALEQAKETEMQLRKEAVDFSFDPYKTKGTERIDLGNGWEAKAVKKLNYGFIKDAEGKTDRNKIEAALQRIEADGPAAELIADRLVKWTPDLSMTEYNQLPPAYKAIIDEVIVTTEGSPTLEIIPPKAKK